MRRFAGLGGYRCVTALATALGTVGSVGACDETDNPAQGGLVVVLETELALPKDIDHVRLEVSQFGRVLSQDEHDVGPDDLRLPAAFHVPFPKNSNPVLIRGVGSKAGTPRIQRDALTPIPETYVGQLRLPLNYLCDGTAESDGSSTCPDDEDTCILGTCAPSEVPESELRRGDQAAPAGSSGDAGAGSASGCFDVATCLVDALPAELDLEDCSTSLPPGADERWLNVALRPRDGQVGVCEDTACWVVLNRGPDGYQLDRQRVLLPGGVCEARSRLGFDAFVSTACLSKTAKTPVCGAWSSVEDPAVQPAPPQGVGEACTGQTSRACGACGTQTRSCRNGEWSAFSECEDEGACEPDATEDCGSGGVRACGGNCEWGSCSDHRCAGAASRACGNCGTQSRSCTGEVWSEWSPCEGEGTCQPNAAEDCAGGGVRACGGSCEWGECGDTACDGPPSQACDNCGTRVRSCLAGAWSAWSACDTQGECSPDATEACGQNGTRVCGGDCSWTECASQVCEGASTRSCRNCGTQSRVCDNGVWSSWSVCRDEGECTPDSTEGCGDGGTLTCGGRCTWGECLNQTCEGSPSRACGNCGTQSRTCDNGDWSDWLACTDEGECEPEAGRACDGGGTQTCGEDCAWQECTGGGGGGQGGGGAGGGGQGGGGAGEGEGGTGGSAAGGRGGGTADGGSGGAEAGDDCPSEGGDMVLVPEGYCVDRTEVVRGAYETWRTSPGVITSHASCAWKMGVINAAAGADTLPAVSIDWCDAVSFCEAMGKRLCGRIGGGANPQAAYQDPAQSQWFNACSANGEHAYPYGDAFDAMQCNAGGWSDVAVAPGSLSTCQAPELGYDGVFDLSGNVWEWEDSCASSANFASCLIRGGDWDSVADSACSGVSLVTRDSVADSVGFRCCAD